ncbi:hypothetical protein J4430_03280 [Candidatus Woesearchaeota archaeon]|nr:hypothetical protein [Candidatus Woesearchaeota archaeon]
MKCPFVERDCTPDCKAFDNDRIDGCTILHRLDRTNMILTHIERKIEKLL